MRVRNTSSASPATSPPARAPWPKCWRKLGATVIDADALVHELQRQGTRVYDDIVAAFGPGILDRAARLTGGRWGRSCLPIPRSSAGWKASVHPAVLSESARRMLGCGGRRCRVRGNQVDRSRAR